jgi:hypothetical protein
MGFKRSEEPAAIRDVTEAPVAGGRRKIGFKLSEEPAVAIEEPSGTHDQPPAIGDSSKSGDVISQKPPPRKVPSSSRPGSGSAQSPVNQPKRAVDTSVPETPRTTAGEPLAVETPRQGSVVSKVEPDADAGTPTERPLSAQDEARLADERLVRSAREQRIADEARMNKLSKELEEIEKIRKELGPRKEPDYVDDAHKKTKADLKQATSDFKKSRRAEAEAEAAQRIDLLKRKDVDPAAALHDPEFKLRAEEELKELQLRVAQNDEWIKANDRDLARAQAELARRQKEFEGTRPGNNQGRQGRDLARERDNARQNLESAQKKLDAVKRRTEVTEKANQKHYQRMQQLDRDINPLDYPSLSGEKGNYGEDQGHEFMDKEKGYKFKGSSKEPASNAKPSDKGLDGVYEKRLPTPDEPKNVVAEAKYDTSQLSPGQGEADWVDERLDKAVGRTDANRMRKEGYEYWKLRYDPKLRRIVPEKLWEWRHNGKFGPGGKPLGAPHYFPPT